MVLTTYRVGEEIEALVLVCRCLNGWVGVSVGVDVGVRYTSRSRFLQCLAVIAFGNE